MNVDLKKKINKKHEVPMVRLMNKRAVIYKARWGIWQSKPIQEVVGRQSGLFCHSCPVVVVTRAAQ